MYLAWEIHRADITFEHEEDGIQLETRDIVFIQSTSTPSSARVPYGTGATPLHLFWPIFQTTGITVFRRWNIYAQILPHAAS